MLRGSAACCIPCRCESQPEAHTVCRTRKADHVVLLRLTQSRACSSSSVCVLLQAADPNSGLAQLSVCALLQAPDPVSGLELIVSSSRAVPLDQPQAGSEGLRAMHLCMPQDVRRKLLEMGAHVDVRSRLGCTSLHYMACQGGLSE